MNKTYKVNEIFYSLQGEGFFTGTPAVFLRFSGCNLKCHFCDTDHQNGRTLTVPEIVDELSRYKSRHLIITGGEPTLQLDEPLTKALKEAGFFIQIETNGTRPVPKQVDWVTCSPKEGPWDIDRVDELKVVYLEQNVETIAETFATRMNRHDCGPILFLQPCSGKNVNATVKYILEHPHWRLSLQTHKYIDIK